MIPSKLIGLTRKLLELMMQLRYSEVFYNSGVNLNNKDIGQIPFCGKFNNNLEFLWVSLL